MPFKHISLSDYKITAEAIKDRYSDKPRFIRRYLTGDDIWIRIIAEPHSLKANVALDYDWRLLRFNESKDAYQPIGLRGSDCLRGSLEINYKKHPFGLLRDVFYIDHIAPSGEYRLELKISRGDKVLTSPEWHNLGAIEVQNRSEVEIKKELQRNAIMWAMVGIVIGSIITLVIPLIYRSLPDMANFLQGILQWIWVHVRA